MERFVTIDRDTPMLLPPDLRDRIPPGHLARFIIDAIEPIDTTSAQINHSSTVHESNTAPDAFGSLGLFLLHWNIFSSRQINARIDSKEKTPAVFLKSWGRK
jgi:hypothetical protein